MPQTTFSWKRLSSGFDELEPAGAPQVGADDDRLDVLGAQVSARPLTSA